MRIGIYSTYDKMGGAAVSFMRLVKSLRKFSLDVQPRVQIKVTDYDFIKSNSGMREKLLDRLVPKLEYFLLRKIYKDLKKAKFSSSLLLNSRKAFLENDFDIAHFHWSGHGFANIKTFKRMNIPIVVTLHDMQTFTGGCYHSSDCRRYQEQCGRCPVLASNSENDISRYVLKRKIENWSALNITAIAPSRWMAEQAEKSSVLRNKNITVIPNCIDTEIFKPIPKQTAREILNLPENKKILLFGAVSGTRNEGKGFDLLKKSLKALYSHYSDKEIHLVIFGQNSRSEGENEQQCTYLGLVHDEYTLSLIYAAADLLLAPSREDNLPNTILESIACGTPAVAYRIGGIPDLITHKFNGYLAEPFNYNEFAQGILYCLQDDERLKLLSCRARETVMNNFTEEIVARKHIELYKKILNTGSYAAR